MVSSISENIRKSNYRYLSWFILDRTGSKTQLHSQILFIMPRIRDQRWKKFTDWNYIISRNSNTGLLPSTIPYRFSKHTLHKKHNWNKTWGNHKLLSSKTYNEQTHSPPGQNQSVFLTWLLPIINEVYIKHCMVVKWCHLFRRSFYIHGPDLLKECVHFPTLCFKIIQWISMEGFLI